MAYDPNDPKDKEIVEGLIAEATTRLKSKNEELIGEIRDLRKGKGDPEKLEKLERQLDEVQTQLDEANKAAKAHEGTAKKATERAAQAEGRVQSLLTTTEMGKALAANNIAPHFHEAVQAMFGSKATIKVTDGVESVMIGDKPLGDALKEFAASDAGKHYVAAGANGGGGANGGNRGNGAAGGKTMTRESFDQLGPQEKLDFSKGGGRLTD